MNQDELLALIDQIYEAAADSARWPTVLRSIADAFDAGEASLSAFSPQAVPWLVAPRTDPAFLRSYGEYYHPLNLFWQEMTRVPIGTAVTDRMVLQKKTLQASPFFNEWSRPQGYLSVMGATLLVEDQWRVEFVVPGKNEFGPEHLKLYDAIAPHLKRAMQLNHRLQTALLDQAYSRAALDSLAQGVLIVDLAARILFANRASDRAFKDGLRVEDGALCSAMLSETAALHSTIAVGAREGLNDLRDTIAISRGRITPLSLLVIPLRVETNWVARHHRAAIIFIGDPDAAGPDERQLQERFGLTRAEAALARELLTGKNIQAVADRLSIKIATARTHLHRILAKTGARSQADLMRLILTTAHWPPRNGFRG